MDTGALESSMGNISAYLATNCGITDFGADGGPDADPGGD
jgi:hypothetical protein